MTTQMIGMNGLTGRTIAQREHLSQSLRDIITTPLGSRIARRNYGSRVFELIDSPLDGATLAKVINTTATAIITWEPRVKVNRILVNVATDGALSIDLYCSSDFGLINIPLRAAS